MTNGFYKYRVMKVLNYEDIIDEMCGEFARYRNAKKDSWGKCKRKFDTMTEDSSARVLKGDKYIRDLRNMLDNLGYTRTKAQIRFHEEFIKASLPHIYPAQEFEDKKEDILKQNNMNAIHQECLICTPRRFGKTTACALFCAAVALCTPEAWVSIFSTGQRASTMLLELTAKIIMNAPDGKSRIVKKNTEQLFIKGDSPGDIRRIYSYPSSVQVNTHRLCRGVSGELGIHSITTRAGALKGSRGRGMHRKEVRRIHFQEGT